MRTSFSLVAAAFTAAQDSEKNFIKATEVNAANQNALINTQQSAKIAIKNAKESADLSAQNVLDSEASLRAKADDLMKVIKDFEDGLDLDPLPEPPVDPGPTPDAPPTDNAPAV